ncbi:tetratricopeptide repeat protein [Salinibacterium sp. UTAS2018]|uniref:tetratricopeptide repeat protein n=1 Tax=Salinibacterium sp. UTAS2018 TaxID=2508880 RepID=UPI00143DB597|nr:tetratricopeptide repeat protein [Salinibacterium sp. UTAS2018]
MTASKVAGWSVQLEVGVVDGALSHVPSREEQELLEALKLPKVSENADYVYQQAFEYINAGDAWTAQKLGTSLQEVEQSSRVWNLLALANAMLGQTLNAEHYYDRWSRSGDVMDFVRAKYGTAMLYARHHPSGLRDLETSATLLDEAYDALHQLNSGRRNGDDVIFDEVFNRNGYALILFRRGKVEESIRLLRWGIDTLSGTTENIAIHRTVLIYNLAQCFTQLEDFDSALRTYEELIGVDPHMPEYRLEMAKCFARIGDLDAAIFQCNTAVESDETLAAAWAQLGVYEGRKGEHDKAVLAFRRAHSINPESPVHLTNVVYNLILAGEHEKALSEIVSWDIHSLAQPEVERRVSLAAEVFLSKNNVTKALAILTQGLKLFPNSIYLAQNYDIIVSTKP